MIKCEILQGVDISEEIRLSSKLIFSNQSNDVK